jgi:hypothetical protein
MMTVAKNVVISEVVSRGKQDALPSETSILYQLALAPEDKLRASIESGYVRQGMSRREAEALKGAPQKPQGEPADMVTLKAPRGSVLHTLYLLAIGDLKDAVGLTDDDVNEIGKRLSEVLTEIQREALRDILA